ncbi:hypothetical protein BMF94_0990 [Rhodotorula taiwanensis]|uniref:Uncharacterized protein n=1 Tax=Rhodotorula taiwanensis TaxID=741276 RepID=A0A2S5BGL7_9BASI|nr:hypothetical protein BMF94_0990 [Rhodotorula taiwanensis]
MNDRQPADVPAAVARLSPDVVAARLIHDPSPDQLLSEFAHTAPNAASAVQQVMKIVDAIGVGVAERVAALALVQQFAHSRATTSSDRVVANEWLSVVERITHASGTVEKALGATTYEAVTAAKRNVTEALGLPLGSPILVGRTRLPVAVNGWRNLAVVAKAVQSASIDSRTDPLALWRECIRRMDVRSNEPWSAKDERMRDIPAQVAKEVIASRAAQQQWRTDTLADARAILVPDTAPRVPGTGSTHPGGSTSIPSSVAWSSSASSSALSSIPSQLDPAPDDSTVGSNASTSRATSVSGTSVRTSGPKGPSAADRTDSVCQGSPSLDHALPGTVDLLHPLDDAAVEVLKGQQRVQTALARGRKTPSIGVASESSSGKTVARKADKGSGSGSRSSRDAREEKRSRSNTVAPRMALSDAQRSARAALSDSERAAVMVPYLTYGAIAIDAEQVAAVNEVMRQRGLATEDVIEPAEIYSAIADRIHARLTENKKLSRANIARLRTEEPSE